MRTQRRHAKELKDAAVGTSKITNFFGYQTSSRDQLENLESNESADDDDDQKNAISSVEEALKRPNLTNDVKTRLMAVEMYFRHLGDGKKRVEASETVAVSLGPVS
ncbi:9662_t:CDS:2 [Entrophospora sp. SA101]|nr:9662_t:CDS:2 [Entrophospora sp. SA101]